MATDTLTEDPLTTLLKNVTDATLKSKIQSIYKTLTTGTVSDIDDILQTIVALFNSGDLTAEQYKKLLALAAQKSTFAALLVTKAADISAKLVSARFAMTQMSTGLDPAALQTLIGLKSSNAINDLEYKTMLGLVFSGDTSVGSAWQDLAYALSTQSPGSQAKAIALFRTGIGTSLGSLKSELESAGSALSSGFSDIEKKVMGVISGSASAKSMLVGSQNPAQVLQLAAQAAAKVSSNPTVQAVAKSVGMGTDTLRNVAAGNYMEAWNSLDNLVLSNLDKGGDSAAMFTTATGLGKDLYKAGKELPDMIEKMNQGEGDPAGTCVAVVQIAQKIINSACALASKLGGNKKDIAATLQWTNVAVGCVTSIATGATMAGPAGYVGAAVGAAMCAMDIITNALGSPPATIEEAKALFYPSKKQMKIIAIDAHRLAMTLKAYYGITNFKDIYDRVIQLDKKWMDPQQTNGYPASQEKGNQGKIPAYSMVHALIGLDGQPTYGQTESPYTTLNLRGIGGAREKYELNCGLKLPGKMDTLASYMDASFDVSSETVEHEAEEIRKRLNLASPTSDSLKLTAKPPYGGGSGQSNSPIAWLAADELLNLFAAITKFEIEHEQKTASLFLNDTESQKYSQETEGIPLRLYTVGDTQRAYAPECGDECNSGDIYSKNCWTNLCYGGIIGRDQGKNGYCDISAALYKSSSNPQDWALREVAFIRLLCAFSYLHMQYCWNVSKSSDSSSDADISSLAYVGATVDALSIPATIQRADPIGDLTYDVKDPLTTAQTPPSPRSYVSNGTVVTPTIDTLWKQIEARGKLYQAVRKAMLESLKTDRKRHALARMANTFDLSYSALLQATRNGMSMKELLQSGLIGTRSQYAAKCKSDCTTVSGVKRCGQAGITVNGRKILCCPSLYLNQNKAWCASMSCHADCIDPSNYFTLNRTALMSAKASEAITGGKTLVGQTKAAASISTDIVSKLQKVQGLGADVDVPAASGPHLQSWESYQAEVLQGLVDAKRQATDLKVGVMSIIGIGGLIAILTRIRG